MNVARANWPIIVGGCHRSGTSLVRRLLNAHSRIFCGPEVKFFRDFYGDFPDDPLRHARFASSARTLLPEADLLQVLGQAYVDVLWRATRRAGKQRWAEKNPENVLYLEDWQRLLKGEFLFVHVVRNPLDALASIKEVEFRLIIPPDLDGRIAHYRRYVEAGLRFTRSYPDRSYRVMYEQLVQSPASALEDLMRWCGERFEPDQLAFNDKPHLRGLEDPKITSTTEIHDRSVRRWSACLTSEEVNTIWRETHELWSEVNPREEFNPTGL